jgi:predicted nuclease of predicted toxin-antitoxin system
MIFFDENVETFWLELVKGKGYKIFSIKENHPGISDKEVLEIAKSLGGLLITEDKDFGELIFSYGIEGVSVLLMRYDQPQYELIEKSVLKCLEEHFNDPDTCFITITKNKIRTRRI